MKQHQYSPLCRFAGGIFCLCSGKQGHREYRSVPDFPIEIRFISCHQNSSKKARGRFLTGFLFYPFFTAL